VLRSGEEEILIDSGTYTYLGDPAARERFRSSAGHNTVRAGGLDQATAAGPFRWIDKPEVRVLARGETFVEAECRARGLKHRRRFEIHADSLLITDWIEGTGPFEQFWHLGAETKMISPGKYRMGSTAKLILAGGAEAHLEKAGEFSWRSRGYGRKEPAAVLRAILAGAGPHLTQITWVTNDHA